MFALLSLWRRVVRLFRSTAMALSKGTKIVWSKKIEEATDIANDYMDHQGRPKLNDTSDGDPSIFNQPTRRLQLRRRR